MPQDRDRAVAGMLGEMPNIDGFLSDTPKGDPKQKTVVCPHCGGLVPI